MTRMLESYKYKTPEGRVELDMQTLRLSWSTLKNKSILDVGAGNAQFAQEAQKKGIAVTCIDTEVPEVKPANIDYVTGNVITMPFQDDSFDLIVSFYGPPYCIESEQELRKMISEILRVLKPGGEFRFTTNPVTIGRNLKNDIFSTKEREEHAGDLTYWNSREMIKKYKEIFQRAIGFHLTKKELFYTEKDDSGEEFTKNLVKRGLLYAIEEGKKQYFCIIRKPKKE